MKTPKFFKTRRCVGTYHDFLEARFGEKVKLGSVEQSEAHFIEIYHVLLQVVTDGGVDFPEPIVREFPTMKMKKGVPSILGVHKWNGRYDKWKQKLSDELSIKLFEAPVIWSELA